jgi:RNA polymerase-interacting CarD/CdnL/TRCF family regulator
LLGHSDSFTEKEQLKQLARVLDRTAARIPLEKREQFSSEGVDVSEVVQIAEIIQEKYKVGMQNILDLVLG